MKKTKQNPKDKKKEKTVKPKMRKTEDQIIKCQFCPKSFSALRWNTGIDWDIHKWRHVTILNFKNSFLLRDICK